MNNFWKTVGDYIVIASGSSIGLAIVIAVACYYIHRGSKYQLSFKETWDVYTKEHVWPLIIGGIIVVAAMFILPDLMAYGSSGKYYKAIQNALHSLRIYSIGLGVVSMGLGFLIAGTGDKALKYAEAKLRFNGEQDQQPKP